jgi:subtilisin family serine protease
VGDYNNDGYEDMILQNTLTSSGDGYYFFAGTSMSAAHVSGVAALVLSVNPLFTNKEVREILEKSAEDIGSPGKDSHYGYGMVDAYAAVKKAEKYSQQISNRRPGGKRMEHRKSSRNYSM